MRKDMCKLICERPRRGVRFYRNLPNEYRKAKRFKLNEDLECLDIYSGVSKLPMKSKTLGWDRKEFNDYLRPLWRFIDKQVGRLWDDVYSEICENINLDSTTRRHVREHVDRHVIVHVTFNEHGDPCSRNGYYGLRELHKGALYKDPTDGILKRAPYPKAAEISDAKREEVREERRKNERFFDREGNQKSCEVPIINGDLNSGGITFRYESTGQTCAWFKYECIVIERVKSVCDGYDYNKNPIYKFITYQTLTKVRSSASKKDIKDFNLN